MGEPRAAASAHSPGTIDAAALRRAFHAGARALDDAADALNAINVFPVPDGDTGSNMSMTMRAAVDEIDRSGGESVAGVMRAAAQGALMGARGNSGVILSQVLAGMAAPDAAANRFDGEALAAALKRGRDAAYRLLSDPKEGTILTAVSAAADAARAAAGAPAIDALARACAAASDAVERTPDLLPVLREAGVVDAGAQGFAVLLDGMLRGLRGEDVAGTAPVARGGIDPAWITETRRLHEGEGAPGFCTEFVVNAPGVDGEAVRGRLQRAGDSVLVVAAGDVVRAHVHTQQPDDVLAYARTLGDVVLERAQDMQAQFSALASRASAPSAAPGKLRAVAVAAGAGIEQVFQSMGAIVVHGGQTMNPSAGDIARAIEQAGGTDVVVLPNNKNIVLAARQAADADMGRGETEVHVIETTSIPEGLAALVALNPEASTEENVAAMQRAAAGVQSAEVTRAARATTLGGVSVEEGQPIGVVDGELCVAERSIEDAVVACVRRMVRGRGGALVTLFAGEGVGLEATSLAERLRQTFGVDAEVIDGGQPHYPYLIGVE